MGPMPDDRDAARRKNKQVKGALFLTFRYVIIMFEPPELN
jgi:hypothetical protein